MTPMNVFVTEGNLEIYLSKLHATWSAEQRDSLLRLVTKEEARMGLSREHLDNGERRVADGQARIRKQRDLVASLAAEQRDTSREALILETLQITQALLESHLQALRERWEQSKL
jgi:hypothetical protein